MTDDPPAPTPLKETHPAAATRASHHGLFYFMTAVILVGGWIAAVYVLPNYVPQLGKFAPQPLTAANPKDEALEQKVETLDGRVSDLGSRVDSIAASQRAQPTALAPTTQPPVSADLSHVESELAALSSTVNGLQAQIRETAAGTAALRSATQGALAEAIAYIQLREATADGRGFSKQLAALRDAAKNDSSLAAPLAKLVPIADKGAPNLAQLRELLSQQMMETEVAIAKTNAHEWWERILAEFRGVISIRPIHGTQPANDMFGLMEQSVDKGDLSDALEQLKSLPPEAQKTLAEWRTAAEARLQLDEALHDVADHLTGGANPGANPAPAPLPEAPARAVPSAPTPKAHVPAATAPPDNDAVPEQQDVP